MTVLFIGGTGNISTSVSKLAVSRGIDLYLLNRGTRPVDIPGAKTLTGDISQPEQIAAQLKEHTWDAVVNWIAFTENDIKRDIELFRGKTKQYLFISSASAYQKPSSHPVITESTPLANPYWQYSRDKIACEDRLNQAYRDEQFPMTIVRPSHTYDTVIPVPIGGWTNYTIIDRMKKGQKVIVHGDGTSLWTITHADDFAKGFIGLLGNRNAIGHAFHITSDEVLTWNQIYKFIAEAVGVQANIVHISSDFIGRFDENLKGNLLGDKAHSAMFDNSKIKRFVPGFLATIPFQEGIKRTIEWFEADPKRQIIQQETHAFMDKIIHAYEKM
ncbi:NAD-dependent dehydratase [candidate division KSB3 bacterium]|uniref:NAD-dependent dehydratase n=1 Tax=candidate division KSB3 bacterium TaxID=2044937 RepID=A0A2G6KIZ3_9BACT|nr:MAG: NAD-dependent dehydratase [candidate division KSB3 bacterium]